VKQIDGNSGNTTANKLYLGGTMSGNRVSGVIANPDDYPGNGNAQALNVVKGESGDWALSGANTYSGTTTVNAGLLRVNGSVANSAVTVTSASGVDGYLGGTGTVGAVTLNSTGGIDLKDAAVGTMTLGGILDINGAAGANNLYFDLGTGANGTDKITVNGNVTMTTSGAGVINLNQLSGTKINAGTYDLIDATGAMPTVGNFTLATTAAFGNTFALQVAGSTLQVVVTSAAAAPPVAFWKGPSDNNWSTVANWVDGAGDPLSGVPGFNTDVSFYSAGATRLTTGILDSDFDINSLTYTADATANTTIGGAPQKVILEGASGAGITVNTPSSGTPTHTISANVSVAATQSWTVASGAALTVSGVVDDFGAGNAFTKVGAGTLRLSGLNTYAGPTIVDEGILEIWHFSVGGAAVPSALGMSSADPANLVLNPGSTLEFVISGDSVKSTDRGFSINGTANGDSVTLKTTKSGGQAYRGVQFTSSASPAYGAPNQTRALILDGTQASSGGNYNNNTRLYASIADNGSGAVSLLKEGVGSWQLHGSSSAYSGGTTINGGALRMGRVNTLPSAGAVTLADASGATLVLDNYSQIIGSLAGGGGSGGHITLGSGSLTVGDATSTAYAGVISGTGGLTKQGIGMLRLTEDNTYSGATMINNGTLVVNGSLAAGSVVTVNSSGTLGGSGGTVNGSTTITSGGTLAPGASGPGTLTFGSGLTLQAGSTLAMELGSASDQVRVSSGTLAAPVAGTLAINVTDAGLTTGAYSLIDWTGATPSSVDATDFTLTMPAGHSGLLSVQGSELILDVVSPLPATTVFMFK
jgi:fibronectin-binding autotransporter adhesin